MAAAHRRVRVRSASSWWVDLADGTVELHVLRRTERAQGGWFVVVSRGADEAAARCEYGRYCRDAYEGSAARAARRANWGPLPV